MRIAQLTHSSRERARLRRRSLGTDVHWHIHWTRKTHRAFVEPRNRIGLRWTRHSSLVEERATHSHSVRTEMSVPHLTALQESVLRGHPLPERKRNVSEGWDPSETSVSSFDRSRGRDGLVPVLGVEEPPPAVRAAIEFQVPVPVVPAQLGITPAEGHLWVRIKRTDVRPGTGVVL